MPISALNADVIKRLKSTQVVSNIWSVVKELIENSLDANAQSIEVYLIDSGLSSIKVRDDGTGISKEDAVLMGLASYTSKLSNVEDLESLATYGFRGIALHSMCCVADVFVTTKTENEQIATIYKLNHDGIIEKVDYTHGNNGTIVEVRDFCRDFPVRRKILSESKSLKKDLKNIEILIKDFSICNPKVRFVLQINDKIIFTKPIVKDTRQALSYVIGHTNVLKLHSIKHIDSEFEINLMVPKKDLTDLTDFFKSSQSYIFVNKRPIKNKHFEQIITKRIIEHFTSKQSNVKKSLFILILTINPAEIDVNLEPNKDKVFLNNKIKIEEILEDVLCNYYEVKDVEKKDSDKENKQSENSEADETIDENNLNNERTFSNKKTVVEKDITPNCTDMEIKKRKILNYEKSIQNFEETIKPLVLSESDSDGECKVPKRKSKSPCMDTIFERFKQEINGEETIHDQAEEETISQLPVVDLGEDFDLSDLQQNKCSTASESVRQSKETSIELKCNIEIGSDAWSRGHISGGGGVDITPAKLVSLEDTASISKHKEASSKSAFGIFFAEIRSQIVKKNPDAKEAEIAKEIITQWRNELSSEERGYYRDLARENLKSLTPKTPRSQKRSLETADPETNKKKFIKFLENMKRENKNDSHKNLVKKTIIPWKISLQDVISSFREKMEMKNTNKNLSIIGQADNKNYWFVKYNGGNWLLNIRGLLAELNKLDISVEQVNSTILKHLLEEKLKKSSSIDSIMYHIHEL